MTDMPSEDLSAHRIIPLATLAGQPRGLSPLVSRFEAFPRGDMKAAFGRGQAVCLMTENTGGRLFLDAAQLADFQQQLADERQDRDADPDSPEFFLLTVIRSALLRHLPVLSGLPTVSFPTEAGPGTFLLMTARLMEQGKLSDSLVQTRQRLFQHMTDLLMTTLLDALDLEVSVAGRRRHRQKHIRHYIEARLHEPDLTPQTIASAYGISARALYQLFDGEPGAVAGWILNRRLERIHADLTDPAHDALTIADIALRHGFRNAAHFSRRFRQKFGVSPRDIRQKRLSA
ncbi:helix-turn-helix domain-containing protein [Gluconobacter morbifer]|uniref:Transcriptional regulator n=1 Tax=Gluconobacter morbifer G707 TaxID=1088869 RepID=G6XK80_9PROT|nr:helix-turn-helix domain-containing protein [Gluconobacter morbifer]EHH67676.1 transcriptional regulator [Gluconobacter morbifer G707]